MVEDGGKAEIIFWIRVFEVYDTTFEYTLYLKQYGMVLDYLIACWKYAYKQNYQTNSILLFLFDFIIL